MHFLLSKINKLHLKRLILLFLIFCVIGLLIVLSFVSYKEPLEPKKPPVAKVVPEAKLISIEPAPGHRSSIDGFTFTAFEFNVPINPSLMVVQVKPYIAIKKTVFLDRPNILYVEPQDRAWDNGVIYTITINKGIIGTHNEELKQDIVYSFSNTVPEYIELPGPI